MKRRVPLYIVTLFLLLFAACNVYMFCRFKDWVFIANLIIAILGVVPMCALIVKTHNRELGFVKRVLKIMGSVEKVNPYFFATFVLLLNVLLGLSFIIIVVYLRSKTPDLLSSFSRNALYVLLLLIPCLFILEPFTSWLTKIMNKARILKNHNVHFSQKSAILIMYAIYFLYLVVSSLSYCTNTETKDFFMNSILGMSLATFFAWERILAYFHYPIRVRKKNSSLKKWVNRRFLKN